MSKVEARLTEWKNGLLDLSRRNRLMHLRPTKRLTLQVAQPACETVFQHIAVSERSFRIHVNRAGIVQQELPRDGQPESGVRAGELRFVGAPAQVETALYTLQNRAKTELEERGVAVLYLAFGMLHWYESGSSQEAFDSPLVLVPVTLEAESGRRTYVLSFRDDDIASNATLIHALRTRFTLELPPLPTQDEWRITDYLRKVRDVIAHQQRWSVTGDVTLSVFPFLKLSMYEDLEAGQQLASEHPIVQALAGDPAALLDRQSEIYELQPDELDEKVDPSQSYQVLDADASQLQAIELAKQGASFVLQGPPGTGKSQTIANIIAELLGNGRSVLFVAEKQAALDVVYKRLERVGLADACLRVSGIKADRRAVVKELERVYLRGQRADSVPAYDFEALVQDRIKLNQYARELHAQRAPLNVSVHEAAGSLERAADAPEVIFAIGDAPQVDVARRRAMQQSVRNLAGHHATIDALSSNLWRDSVVSGDSPETRRQVAELLERLETMCLSSAAAADRLAEVMGAETGQVWTCARASALARAARALAQGPAFLTQWMDPAANAEAQVLVRDARALWTTERSLSTSVGSVFEAGIMRCELTHLAKRLTSEFRWPWQRLGRAYREMVRELSELTVVGSVPGYSQLKSLISQALTLKETRTAIETLEPHLTERLNGFYQAADTQWEPVVAGLQAAATALSQFPYGVPPKLYEQLYWVFDNRASVLDLAAAVQEGCDGISADTAVASTWFAPEATHAVILANAAALPWQQLSLHAQRLAGSLSQLGEWTALARAAAGCRDAGLGDVLALFEGRGIPPDQYLASFERRFWTLWLDYWITAVPLLRDLDATSHDNLIGDFRRLDDQLKLASQRSLVQRIAQRRPQPVGALNGVTSSQSSILLREAQKQRRLLPLRSLFTQIPELLLCIKPCLLMSPIAIGQYLPLNVIRFDTVIFDEASQVRPQDAIGAIMRAQQAIVVGDEQQLPPTPFFEIAMSDDDFASEEYSEEGAFESILNLFGASERKRSLMWHYRSRREGLIAFSNQHFYDGRLITFPGAGSADGDTGVKLVPVPNGVYERGGTRTNRAEVARVVELVREHAVRMPHQSLGIVAFSQAPAEAIDRALDDERAQSAEVEALFFRELEPAFVKNLENVQGDERDVMIFSVGYGRDRQGKMSLNMGPLNSEQGYRRLNVAITRARERVYLVSSISFGDIPEDPGKRSGVQALRAYLEYAVTGQLRMATTIGGASESVFEEQVAEVLKARGYQVELQVGCSGYRIDMAVRHPERPGRYVIGVECDGATYHSSKTARDRDRLREQLLRDQGWTLYRIWSTDWFRSRDREIAKLVTAVDKAIRECPLDTDTPPRAPRPTPVVAHPRPTADVPPTESPSLPDFDAYIRAHTRPYVELALPKQPGDFYASEPAIGDLLVRMANELGYIHFDLATQNLCGAWGLGRAGSKIRALVDRAARHQVAQKRLAIRGEFVFPVPQRGLVVRTNVENGARRRPEHVAPEESAAAIRLVLENQITLAEGDLIMYAARMLGYQRTAVNVRLAVQQGLDLLVKTGDVRVTEGRVSLTTR
ncbi:MAG: DUF4011 domain-containing protein [Anaerolineales bacterium]|nr:DUF4011 domain-containing protein [Anaerolineales bacterium]